MSAIDTTIADILALSSPRPWTYHNDGRSITPRDWIEDASGNTVVSNIGHLHGPLICAAVNYLYHRETEAEAAVTSFLLSAKAHAPDAGGHLELEP